MIIKTLMVGAGNDSTLLKTQIKKIISQLTRLKAY
jgi:hypothetical protein